MIILIDQPDLGQSILLYWKLGSTIFVSGVSLFYILSFFIVIIFYNKYFIFFTGKEFGYIINRSVIFIDPKGDSFQSTKAL